MLEIITAVATALATVLSAISVILLVRDRTLQRRLEKMELIVTPKKKLANTLGEIFYLYLSFSNEPALPISILDLRIYESGDYSASNTSFGNESGTLDANPIDVIETERVSQVVKKDYHALSATVPFVIGPYGVFGGYFAFHEAGQDSFIILHKEIDLLITTSRKSYKIQMDLKSDNFYECSYRDDGLMFGRSVIGECYQDTSIPKNY